LVVNVAVTDALLVNVTLQVLVPAQPPDQPANVEVPFAAAVSVTMVPLGKLALHVGPQLIPAGLLAIVPAPVSALWTVSWKELGGGGLEVLGGGGLEVLLLEPQPQKTNEMIARQKRLEKAFSVDIVRRELRPAYRANVASPDTD
jgi:hypothetical protein